jgi:hypothetical protein
LYQPIKKFRINEKLTWDSRNLPENRSHFPFAEGCVTLPDMGLIPYFLRQALNSLFHRRGRGLLRVATLTIALVLPGCCNQLRVFWCIATAAAGL